MKSLVLSTIKQANQALAPKGPVLWKNLRLISVADQKNPLRVIEDGAIVVVGGLIAYAGQLASLPSVEAELTIDCQERLVTPGLIDCHTHIVFGGERSLEFEMRQNGKSYVEIAAAGGGIISTVKATREASFDSLVASALIRLDALLSEGVTTIEIKSGYGLTVADELKMLKVAKKLADLRPVRIKKTYLAAHSFPPEYKANRQGYITEVILPGMKLALAQGLVDAVDGFCESIAFSTQEISQVFDFAKSLGLPVKLHAEQLSNSAGAALAASYQALSADHLEYIDEEGISALAKANSVAVLLPGAFYCLNETKVPDIATMRKHNLKLAVATDCNPGTSPLSSILLAMNMASTLFGLSLSEAILGTTHNAAKALGVDSETGSIETGKSADFAIWDLAKEAELVFNIGLNRLNSRVFKGVLCQK